MSFVNTVKRLFFLSLVLTGAISAAAQVPNQSSVKGKVVDPNRAAVVGARIVVQAKNGSKSSTVTDQYGDFLLVLEPGDYTVAVTANGFSDHAAVFVRAPQQ